MFDASRDQGDGCTESDGPGDPPNDPDAGDPIVSCEFQDGTLLVYDDRILIRRTGASKFEDRVIATNQIRDVTYAGRLVIGYLQIDQVDVEAGDGGLFSTPVDPNTVHFGRGKRDCARRARDAILERMGSTPE